MDDTPKIYIADLADYNAGELRGFYLDPAGKTVDEISGEIHDFLKERGHEEWAIHDYEGFPNLGECAGYDAIVAVSAAVKEHGCEVVETYLGYGYTPDDLDQLGDYFRGIWDSEEDFAYELVQDCYDLKKMMGNLSAYFDYKQFTRDLFMGDYWSAKIAGGKIAVFEAH